MTHYSALTNPTPRLGRHRFVEPASSLYSTVYLKQPSECTLQENPVCRHHRASDPYPRTLLLQRHHPANVLLVALLRQVQQRSVTWCLSNRAKRCMLTGNTGAITDARTTVLQKFFDAILCRPNILLFTRSQELIPIESVLRRPPKRRPRCC